MDLRISLAAGLAAAVLSLAAPAAAQELTIGLSTPVTTMDPHFHNLTPNNSIAKHLFICHNAPCATTNATHACRIVAVTTAH